MCRGTYGAMHVWSVQNTEYGLPSTPADRTHTDRHASQPQCHTWGHRRRSASARDPGWLFIYKWRLHSEVALGASEAAAGVTAGVKPRNLRKGPGRG